MRLSTQMQTTWSSFHFSWYTVPCKVLEWLNDYFRVCVRALSIRRAAGAVSARVQQRWRGCCGSWFRVRASCQSTAGAACWAVGERLLLLCPPPPALHPNHCHCSAEGHWHRGTSATAVNTISIPTFPTCVSGFFSTATLTPCTPNIVYLYWLIRNPVFFKDLQRCTIHIIC